MEYRVRAIGKACEATGEQFEPGQRIWSALSQRDGEFVRQDYSEAGWNGPGEGVIGYWQSTVPQPEVKPPGIDPEAMFQLFEQSVEDTNPQQQRFCYVLALLLIRKRRMQLDGTRVDGEIVWLQLTGSGGEGPFEVPDQQLDEHDIAALQAQLEVQLQESAA